MARASERRSRYVALLRGVNVGGKGIVSMAALAATFRRLGYEDVRTYINSGNVLFSAPPTTEQRLSGRIEAAITEDTGLEVHVVVLTAAALRSIAAAIPDTWAHDAAVTCNVLFLWSEIDDANIVERLPTNPGVDAVRYTPGAVIWRYERANASRSRLTKIVGTKLYRQMTIRNANTVRKLDTLLAG